MTWSGRCSPAFNLAVAARPIGKAVRLAGQFPGYTLWTGKVIHA